MKKKLFIIVGLIVVLVIAALVSIKMSPNWSNLTFEASVCETIKQPNGEMRLIVERTTKIYGNPKNSLHIGDDTKLIGNNGEVITLTDIKNGNNVKVTLKDSFIEETPFYYPTVYEIKIIQK